ncbi:hypothetical protein GW17_00019624 [Ensete ventricosum]|nr:hypothetical protein GW17_00019624 [Ensete ventricosum]
MVLHKGEIAEMRTGEGKTLVAVLPAYLNALSGKGVHVVTVNDYLARRDCEWVGQVPRFLGLQVGLIQPKELFLRDVNYIVRGKEVLIVDEFTGRVMQDESDVVFRATTGKWRAVVVEISRMHKTGRPVLVGTTSVEQSDALSEQLHDDRIPHEVLNAKPENVEREAEIVAQSGRLGAVTIATNMAGRGTDIILGGNAEFMARLKLREILMPRYL